MGGRSSRKSYIRLEIDNDPRERVTVYQKPDVPVTPLVGLHRDPRYCRRPDDWNFRRSNYGLPRDTINGHLSDSMTRPPRDLIIGHFSDLMTGIPRNRMTGLPRDPMTGLSCPETQRPVCPETQWLVLPKTQWTGHQARDPKTDFIRRPKAWGHRVISQQDHWSF